MNRILRAVAAGLVLLQILAGCAASSAAPSRSKGHLLIIGGGLDDDVRSIYERFIKLASAHGPPRLVLALTATEEGYDENSEFIAKSGALRAWAPSAPLDVIRRKSSTAETVAAIDCATGILFTGGDQARIASRYRPEGRETPESLALRRLLARGGVVAGCSAGDTMMGDFMALQGDNTPALDAAKNAKKGGLQEFKTGSGMDFLPWAITESHFFERDRVARFVATLEKSGHRLGIGVGENAAVEVDLVRGVVIGVSESDSLLLDVALMSRDGNTRRNVRARLIRQGDRVSLRNLLNWKLPPPAIKPATPAQTIHITSPSQSRQLALWRFFMNASQAGSGVWKIRFDEGWQITAWPDRDGWVIFDVSLAPSRT